MTIPHSRGGRCEVCKDCNFRISDAAEKAQAQIKKLKDALTKVEQRNIVLERERNEAQLEVVNLRQRNVDISMEASARPSAHDVVFAGGLRGFWNHADIARDVDERAAAQ